MIGFGTMGKRRFQYLKQDPRVKMTAICDIIKETRTEKIPFFSDYKQLLSLDLDAVFIATPNQLSAQLTLEALRRGFHVFCEKPPAMNVLEVEQVIQEEQKHSSLKLKYGFNHRYHGSVKEAKTIIDTQRLGKVLSLRGVYGKSGGNHFKNNWRANKQLAGGGILLDQGIHMLDLFQYFCGSWNEYKSFVQNNYWNFSVEDNVYAILRNKTHQIAMLHSSSTLWKHTFYLMIVLDEGYLELKGIHSGTMSYGKESLVIGKRQFENETFALGNPREEIIYFDKDNSWDQETNDFLNHIIMNTSVVHGDSQDALAVMRIIEHIYASDSAWHGENTEREKYDSRLYQIKEL